MSWTPGELAYCTNVHAGESIAEINGNLERFVGPVRQSSLYKELSAGLWISHEASLALASPDQLAGLKQTLKDNRLSVKTLNGFPFGGFHQASVKAAVYQPDWSQAARRDYTQTLATVLASCLAEDEQQGTISTLPLGFVSDWTPQKHQQAIKHLLQLVLVLQRLEAAQGKHIRVCLEMEPACVLQHTHELLTFFQHDLLPACEREGISTDAVYRYLGVCFDVCHQAVMFEEVTDSLAAIVAAGICIGKIQLSNAIEVRGDTYRAVHSQLTQFVEPRYLHQTSVRRANGELVFFQDLSDALAQVKEDGEQQWRVHFHVPLQLDVLNSDGLMTTRSATEAVFGFLAENRAIKPHLEIETYTWNVLPETLRPVDDRSLIAGINAELAYVLKRLQDHQLITL